jgi:hypothetical protein
MAGLGELLFGKSAPPPLPPAPPPAPPLASYPSSEDAEYARKSGFGYGTSNDAYAAGDVGRIFGTTDKSGRNFTPQSAQGLLTTQATDSVDDPRLSQNVNLRTSPGLPGNVGDTLTRAALAVNRMPVANFGFDPSRAVFDTRMENPNIEGVYNPKSDNIYAVAGQIADPSSIVHESLHRGLQKLRDHAKETEDGRLAEIFKQLPREELIVRHLMQSQAGNPEAVGTGKDGIKEREAAKSLFDDTFWGNRGRRTSIEDLNRYAEDAYAKRRPGGPR